jgi:hypothetical protein
MNLVCFECALVGVVVLLLLTFMLLWWELLSYYYWHSCWILWMSY